MYGTSSALHMIKLVRLDNKILRIPHLRNNRSHVGELYKSFSTLPIFELYDLQVATFIHKAIHHPTEVPTIF
jgi:hypothetical protein